MSVEAEKKPVDSTTVYEYATKALKLAGEFGTLPTPPVYDVWYRFAEGDQEITAELEGCMESSQVSFEQILNVHRQWCVPNGEEQMSAVETINAMIEEIDAAIDSQIETSQERATALNKIGDQLSDQDVPTALIEGCAAALRRENAMIRQSLDEHQQLLSVSQTKVESLHRQMDELLLENLTDDISGLGNRRAFQMQFKQALSSPGNSKNPWFLALIDIDNFKEVNERFGSDGGNQVISNLGKLFQEQFTELRLFRISGDLFAGMGKFPGRKEVADLTERIETVVESKNLTPDDDPWLTGYVTLSVGIAMYREGDDQIAWHERTQELLRRSKKLGRGQAVVSVN